MKRTVEHSAARPSGGFTLVEVALALAVVGVTLSGGVLSTAQYLKAEKIRQTREKIELVNNALSSYAQQHYRLPCPADPGAPAAQQGLESNGGNCFTTTAGADSNATLYWNTEGVVPWKELGIPQDMVVDSWRRYITYKPAPNLTINTQAATMMETGPNKLEVANACRSALWYDDRGTHINRAKALFCCNTAPNTTYLGGPAPNANWRNNGVVATTTARATASSATGTLPPATPVFATSNWMDDPNDVIDTGPGDFKNSDVMGDFSDVHHMEGGSDVPLIRATSLAVTLISHGGNGNMAFLEGRAKTNRSGATLSTATGTPAAAAIADVEEKNAWPPQMFAAVLGHPKVTDRSYDPLGNTNGASDDIVSYLRSDQLFARAGGGSCENAPTAAFLPYYCVRKDFSAAATSTMLSNPDSPGGTIAYPELFGLQEKLINGVDYEMSSTFRRRSDEAGYRNSVGIYMINDNGEIDSVQMVMPNMKDIVQDVANSFSSGIAGSKKSVGVFMVPNGYDVNGGYSGVDFERDKLAFKCKLANGSTRAAHVTDNWTTCAGGISLVAQNPKTGASTVIHGQDEGASGSAYHMYSNLNKGNVNRKLREDNICKPGTGCPKVTSIQWVGVDPADKSVLQVGFEDLSDVTAYLTATGYVANAPVALRLKDEYGAYIARIGDNDYDDVTFGMSLASCPKGKK